jgi:quercetin dioxygenase-like cupin family protein
MTENRPIFIKSNLIEQQPTRRAGIKERRILKPEDSSYQNIVIIEAEEGAIVELHQITTSESIFVFKGIFEITLPDQSQTLEAGDLCYFHPMSSHGIRCVKGPGQFLLIFAPSKLSIIGDKWLRTMYVEALKQYCHEDNISQTRNNLFLGIQTVLVVILTGISGFFLSMDPVCFGSNKIWIGFGGLGVFIIVFAIIATQLASCWEEVTKSGRGYLNLRWVTIKAIEDYAGLNHINIAGIEHNWKEFLKSNPGKEYHPFIETERLKQHAIPPLGKVSGWKSLLNIINIIKILWYFLLVIGVTLIVTTVILWLLS